MAQIRVLFWDVGGVLLTNAWDHEERSRAVERFRLQKDEFESRHKEIVAEFERGNLTLDQYLEKTIFYQQRSFTPEEFRNFMFSLSKPKSEVLEFARRLASRFVMATINNESRELNAQRIRTFGLAEIFDLFISSCYVELRKPDESIYQLALNLLQKTSGECCFIDDRPVNVAAAAKVGMQTVLMQNPVQLKSELQKLGVSA
ncbi:MAG TPA: HAD-IA family hydrolase [Terriglobales bacterium]|nr:HAD-IA family hydrolase [Terriglobales bacterium]